MGILKSMGDLRSKSYICFKAVSISGLVGTCSKSAVAAAFWSAAAKFDDSCSLVNPIPACIFLLNPDVRLLESLKSAEIHTPDAHQKLGTRATTLVKEIFIAQS